jgi:hypothetical protein
MGKKLQTMLDHRSVYSSTTSIPNDDGEKFKHVAKFDAMLATGKDLGMVNLRLFPVHLSLSLHLSFHLALVLPSLSSLAPRVCARG